MQRINRVRTAKFPDEDIRSQHRQKVPASQQGLIEIACDGKSTEDYAEASDNIIRRHRRHTTAQTYAINKSSKDEAGAIRIAQLEAQIKRMERQLTEAWTTFVSRGSRRKNSQNDSTGRLVLLPPSLRTKCQKLPSPVHIPPGKLRKQKTLINSSPADISSLMFVVDTEKQRALNYNLWYSVHSGVLPPTLTAQLVVRYRQR